MNPPRYCDEPHDNVPLGCYGTPRHKGKHWAWGSAVKDDSMCVEDKQYPYDSKFWWETPTEPVFSQAEVGILLTTLVPVEQFFPELKKKLELMQANG